MRIRINNPALTGDLIDYLRRNACEAVQMSRDIVAVSLANGLPYDAARLELDFRLTDWLVEHADARAVVID